MSYDLYLVDPVTKETLELDAPHHMRGGTYCVGGTRDAHINITYNYAPHYYKHLDEKQGIRVIYNMTGAESIPKLKEAISKLGDEVTDDYWESTEGNAKKALFHCLALAQMRPDGIWEGD
jgi:hypothetical protein